MKEIKRKLFVTIEGSIGVGKSTLTKRLAADLKYKAYYEELAGSVKKLRTKFYKDMHRWAFPLQIKLFQKRFKQHLEIILMRDRLGAIQDRSIYGDIPFAEMLSSSGHISPDEMEIYNETWQSMKQFIVQPDIMIFLVASPEVLLKRIKNDRQRPEECHITKDYLNKLSIELLYLYQQKMQEGIACRKFDWDDSNIVYEEVLHFIREEELKRTPRYARIR